MTRRVVVGVDGSLIAVRALDWAAEEAERRGAALHIVYAVPDRDEAEPVLASAEARMRDHHPRLTVTTASAQGSAVRALARESEGADLTVVGTRGLGRFTGAVFGSVSLRLAAHTHGPLLVVRGDHRCDGGREVLLGLESDSDADAAAYAFQEAERRGVRLRVLHAWTHRHTTPELPPIAGTSRGQQEAARREAAEEAVPRFDVAELRRRYTGVGVDSLTVRTAPAHALLEATRQAGLVVVGAHRHGHADEPRLGTVGHTLLHRSHCPVVVVPTR
ncbi:nucleotide-binding universal stress UspA family protein [Streptomyces sp. SAI-208]|uniref:universal stress protein n=1 Tax=unclassified Streptomyces TaxID=2593676 RepID=UPI0024753D6E|nr:MULTISPECIES: universal stress protein [unclassified Streptomyces]MDH6521416.1 nucleotide-binding universal stress UspA family protein [Streptomyces sp. SAI-090]MDH6553640.1 nucleotide-binding universal stress UspA family protein [Streptomyces sp. SAI-041]MDH6572720.1 nucleotide-binding universal stress UspA family protein [Streptomyces sp. SAI-117]MDH6582318.1 nucleotide-binding universal stress UspA family protein [Streptomyces sp. SAI-133]MDH6612416.1 nucleotide-binding universal stress 